MSEPTTTSAFGLLDGFKWLEPKEWDRLKRGILAIEAEAREQGYTDGREDGRIDASAENTDEARHDGADAARADLAARVEARVWSLMKEGYRIKAPDGMTDVPPNILTDIVVEEAEHE